MLNFSDVALCCPQCGTELRVRQADELRCESCSTSFPLIKEIPSLLPPALSDQRVSTYFSSIAEGLRDDNLSYVPFDSPQRDRHLKILSSAYLQALQRWIPAGSRVLDVGCGHGSLLAEALPKYKMIGLDFAFDMLPFARSAGYAVVHGDAKSLPFAASQFDAVICGEVVQHFENPQQILHELVRVCRPGGTIVVSTLNRYSVARFLLRLLERSLRPSAAPVPILRRGATEVLECFDGDTVSLREIAWVLSPSKAVAFSRQMFWAPFATNFIICLQKR